MHNSDLLKLADELEKLLNKNKTRLSLDDQKELEHEIENLRYEANTRFAVVWWLVDDVMRAYPDWTEEQCLDWLRKNEETLEDVMIRHGNDLIDMG